MRLHDSRHFPRSQGNRLLVWLEEVAAAKPLGNRSLRLQSERVLDGLLGDRSHGRDVKIEGALAVGFPPRPPFGDASPPDAAASRGSRAGGQRWRSRQTPLLRAIRRHGKPSVCAAASALLVLPAASYDSERLYLEGGSMGVTCEDIINRRTLPQGLQQELIESRSRSPVGGARRSLSGGRGGGRGESGALHPTAGLATTS